MTTARIGDVAWYVVENTREKAEKVAINGSTPATVRPLTGPQSGQQLEAPWGIIQPQSENDGNKQRPATDRTP
jgi:hypothetical protein